MTDVNGTVSTIQLIRPEPVSPLTSDRVCSSCGGRARLLIPAGEGSFVHLNMSECRAEE